MKPAQVAAGEYDARIRRAEYLASKYPFAAEVLLFYAKVAEFQQSLYSQAKTAKASPATSAISLRADLPAIPINDLLPHLGTFLSLIERAGPSPLANAARQISHLDAIAKRSMLQAYWDLGGLNDQFVGPFAQFISRAFVQPLAELAAQNVSAPPAVATPHTCPLCGGQSFLGVLRQEGDGGKRQLICSFCLREWDFRRIYCPACGEADEKKLPVYVAEQFPHVRVEACETCKIYIRSIDLTRDGNAVPVVDDLAAIPLSLWTHDRGYTRLHHNLFGT